MAGIQTKKAQQAKQGSLEDVIAGATATAAEAEPTPVKRGAGKPRHADADDWTRQTFIIRKDFLQRINEEAYWQRRTTKVVLDMALEAYFKDRPENPIPES